MVLQKLAGNMGIGLHVGQCTQLLRFFIQPLAVSVLVLESCVYDYRTNVQ